MDVGHEATLVGAVRKDQKILNSRTALHISSISSLDSNDSDQRTDLEAALVQQELKQPPSAFVLAQPPVPSTL